MDYHLIADIAMSLGLVIAAAKILMQDSRIKALAKYVEQQRTSNAQAQWKLSREVQSGFSAMGLLFEPGLQRDAEWKLPPPKEEGPEPGPRTRSTRARARGQTRRAR